MIHTIKNDFFLFLRGLWKREYPDFIFKNESENKIPVFIYHHIPANEFEKRLQHIKQNGYTTLTADELERALTDRSAAPDKAVVFTFDDGLADVYEVAFPLLKKYQLKVVVFLLPGWVGNKGVLSWEQIDEMHHSGLVDFQSHSMNHPAIFTSHELFDFYNPGYENFKLWDIPITHNDDNTDNSSAPQLGTPLYKFFSRFSDAKRFYPDVNTHQQCVNFVAQNGGAQFFTHKNWKKSLFSFFQKYQQDGEKNYRFESVEKQTENIARELQLSKTKIEEHLGNKDVHHFACPWNQLGVLTANLLAEHGYTMSFMGMSQSGLLEKNLKIRLIKRITGDFISCLPGEGRQSFFSVMMYKILRRLKSGTTY